LSTDDDRDDNKLPESKFDLFVWMVVLAISSACRWGGVTGCACGLGSFRAFGECGLRYRRFRRGDLGDRVEFSDEKSLFEYPVPIEIWPEVNGKTCS
jgi:hypothetical protein